MSTPTHDARPAAQRTVPMHWVCTITWFSVLGIQAQTVPVVPLLVEFAVLMCAVTLFPRLLDRMQPGLRLEEFNDHVTTFKAFVVIHYIIRWLDMAHGLWLRYFLGGVSMLPVEFAVPWDTQTPSGHSSLVILVVCAAWLHAWYAVDLSTWSNNVAQPHGPTRTVRLRTKLPRTRGKKKPSHQARKQHKELEAEHDRQWVLLEHHQKARRVRRWWAEWCA